MTGEVDNPQVQGPLRRAWASCRPVVLPVVLVVAILDLYAVWFVGVEQTLYHADQVTYWSYSQQLARLLLASPGAAVGTILRSIANNDLNLLPAVPVAFVMAVFGSSRLVYLLAVITIYGSATVAMLVVALGRFGLAVPGRITALLFLLVPMIWRPVFVGYLGLGGVALALAILALVLPDPETPKGPRSMALAGVLLATLVLFRRWWGIWGVAFCALVVLVIVWDLVRYQPVERRAWRKVLEGPLVLGLTAFATLVVFAAPIIVQRATTDYADRFAAYSLEGWPQRVAAIAAHLGGLSVLLVVASVVFLVVDGRFRGPAVKLMLLVALTFSLMISIQDHSPQHWYLYDPSILLLGGLALGRLTEILPFRRRPIVWSAIAAVGLLMTTAVFVPGCLESADPWLMPSDRVRPQKRSDLAEVDRLLTYLDHRYQNGTGSVYVLASSGVLSDHVLAFANLSLGIDHPSIGGIVASAHVDRRDGFPLGLLVADAVVVTDPVQIHLRAGEQRVVVEPSRSFLDGTDIARPFRKLPVEFTLEGGVRAYIFERVRPTTDDDVEPLSSRLRVGYPDRPEIYAP